MERRAVGGESPVPRRHCQRVRHLSRSGHEESGLNQRGPSRKAKHYRETDSEPVP